MKRPVLVWLAFAACAAVGCGVLGWFTREMLRLDRESTAARRLAVREENIRLALWRMDSALAAVHGLEAARPAQEYAPFFPAQVPFSAALTPLPARTVLLPSSLLGYTPPFIRLHFQLEPDQRLLSPQAPPVDLRAAAVATGARPDQLDAATRLLDELQVHLSGSDFVALLPPIPVAPFSAQALPAEGEAVSSSRGFLLREEPAAKREPAPAAAPPPPATAAPRAESDVQQLKSVTEQRERAITLDLANRYGAEVADQRRMQTAFSAAESFAASATPAPAQSTFAGRQDAPASSAPPARSAANRAQDVSAAGSVATNELPQQSDVLLADASKPSEVSAVVVNTSDTLVAPPANAEGPLHAVWMGSELLFARRASVEGREVVQGAWLDWPELQAWLLSRVSDLLPDAGLVPAAPGSATTAIDAARRLAFLPAQLVPGAVTGQGRAPTSLLRISLGIAWAGAAIGLLALAALLRGTLRLSERRGAFVSAVTHELRTPLTTFRMYTEMLSSGMVQDEAKRQGYVETLHKESERLSHLVENVLSYARLERGRAAARVEDTTPGALLARIEERLRQRAQQGGLGVRLDFADGVSEAPLHTDTTAVEQVLFNLVDNATKYGRPRNGGGEIVIAVASLGPNRLAIRVTDPGSGLTPAARKRLFQPFSKSATEAAHSQPGVGLGLALCRRLARDELHGDLVLERTGPDGTVFRLELRR